MDTMQYNTVCTILPIFRSASQEAVTWRCSATDEFTAMETPLHFAARGGVDTKDRSSECIKALLDHRADMEDRVPDGFTALLYGVSTNNLCGVKTLCDARADCSVLLFS